LTPFLYRSAVTSSTYWDATVRALVNLGRVPLAAALGLRMPATIAEERRMWRLLTKFTFDPFDKEHARQLDEFRLQPSESNQLPLTGVSQADREESADASHA
jgi:hypothetical protein